jgi:hypothetical protein
VNGGENSILSSISEEWKGKAGPSSNEGRKDALILRSISLRLGSTIPPMSHLSSSCPITPSAALSPPLLLLLLPQPSLAYPSSSSSALPSSSRPSSSASPSSPDPTSLTSNTSSSSLRKTRRTPWSACRCSSIPGQDGTGVALVGVGLRLGGEAGCCGVGEGEERPRAEASGLGLGEEGERRMKDRSFPLSVEEGGGRRRLARRIGSEMIKALS